MEELHIVGHVLRALSLAALLTTIIALIAIRYVGNYTANMRHWANVGLLLG